MFFLIIGLGNPGDDYRSSRHNAGFAVLERLAHRGGISLTGKRYASLFGQGRLGGQRVALLQPQTYMNLSGEAVLPASQALGVPCERLAVLHDDMDLDLGRIQVRRGGGDGGHRGIRSIIEHLERADFIRLRLGVGRPAAGQEAADHVLSPLTGEEQAAIDEMVERGAEAVLTWLTEGLQVAMNRHNPWKKTPAPDEEDDEEGLTASRRDETP